jgi:bacteriorhodopsin
MDNQQKAQAVAFLCLTVGAVILLFSSTPWLAVIPGIAATAYYAMLHDRTNTQKYRYSDWILTTPLMLLAILTVNDASIPLTVGILIADVIMIATGYLGAIADDESTRIAFFTAGCIAFLPILYVLASMKKARYAVLLTLVLWLLYPVVWYLDEEGLIGDDRTTIAYSFMDVAAKVGLVNLLHL